MNEQEINGNVDSEFSKAALEEAQSSALVQFLGQYLDCSVRGDQD